MISAWWNKRIHHRDLHERKYIVPSWYTILSLDVCPFFFAMYARHHIATTHIATFRRSEYDHPMFFLISACGSAILIYTNDSWWHLTVWQWSLPKSVCYGASQSQLGIRDQSFTGHFCGLKEAYSPCIKVSADAKTYHTVDLSLFSTSHLKSYPHHHSKLIYHSTDRFSRGNAQNSPLKHHEMTQFLPNRSASQYVLTNTLWIYSKTA